MMLNVIGYARSESDYEESLNRQVHSINEFVATNNMNLINIIMDEHTSAQEVNIDMLNHAIALLDGKNVDGIVVTALSKLVNNTNAISAFIDKYSVYDISEYERRKDFQKAVLKILYEERFVSGKVFELANKKII